LTIFLHHHFNPVSPAIKNPEQAEKSSPHPPSPHIVMETLSAIVMARVGGLKD
jgi:hypothetical protein